MLKYHAKYDLAAYTITCIFKEEITWFSAKEGWWLQLSSENHEIMLQAPPDAPERGMEPSPAKYVEAWAKDLNQLAERRITHFQTLCQNNGLAGHGNESELRNRLKSGLNWDDRRLDTEICSLMDTRGGKGGGSREEDQPAPDSLEIVCRKCRSSFSLKEAVKHDSLKCEGLENFVSRGKNEDDDDLDDSSDESDEEESDGDDDEVVKWETFIGKSVEEQQELANELELGVEILPASALKPAAKEVDSNTTLQYCTPMPDKVQLLHRRIVVALHEHLEGLKRRREELQQSRLQLPLVQEREAMVEWMRENC
jgi:hypothetical protein